MKYNSLIDRRGNRMNYFAVLALKARKSMWEGDLTEAFKRAQEFVDKVVPSIRLVNSTDMASSYQRNKRFTPENIFGLYDRNQLDYLAGYLPPVTQNNTVTNQILLPQYTTLANNLYKNAVHGSANDYRLLNWFAPTASNQYRFVKLDIDPLDETYLSQFEVQMINLPEMYYIMAEAKALTAPEEAMNILNELRISRNLTAAIPYTPGVTTPDDVRNYIIEECRKDYIGEGYMYLMYKRMYHAIVRPSGTVQPSLGVFRFPVPNDEGTYNTASK